MSKIKKISIVHFEKENVKKVEIGGKKVSPIYFRVVYDRKKVTLSSYCFNNFVIRAGSFSDTMLADAIEKEKMVIEKIIELIKIENGEFKLELFKDYFKRFSVNVLDTVNEFILSEISNYALNHNKERLADLANQSKKHFNAFYLMDLIWEFDILLKQRIDEALDYKYSLISELTNKYSFYHEEWSNENIEESKRIHNKFYQSYIPLIEWNNKSKDIKTAIANTALEHSFIQESIDSKYFDEKRNTKIEEDLNSFVSAINSKLK